MKAENAESSEFQNIYVPGLGRLFKKRFRRKGAWYQSPNWTAAICYRGKELLWSSGSPKESVARKFLINKHEEISRGRFTGITQDKVTFDNLAEDFINDYKINGKRSLADARNSVRHLRALFGYDKALDISADRVRKYVDNRQKEIAERLERRAAAKLKLAREIRHKAKDFMGSDRASLLNAEANGLEEEAKRLRGGNGNATINRELAALKRMFTLAVQAGKLLSRPHIAMLEENNARQGFVEHGCFLTLQEKLPDYLRDPITFLYYSGWRVSEMRSLEWRDLDLAGRVARLRPEVSKNKDGRLLPLTGELLEVLKRANKNRRLDCRFVFQRDGLPIGDFKKAWKTACKAASQPGLLVHDLRRTAVRNLSRAGISEPVAMRFTGHKTRSVFDRYNIVNEKDLAQAADQLESYLRGQPTVSTVQPMRPAVNDVSDTIQTQGRSVDPSVGSKWAKNMEPPAGVEPATY